MPDQDIFDKENKEEKPIIDDKGIPTPEPSKDDDNKITDQLLTTIVNENGEQKYKTVEEALKGVPHAQLHIAKIERELAELKDKDNASDKLDELLEAVKQSKVSGEEDNTSPTMKPEDVLSIVQDYFTDTKAAEARQNNIDTVTKVFRDRYGNDASKELYGKADDLGFTRSEINSMIAQNPNAALKVLGVEIKGKPNVDTITVPGGVNSGSFQETAPSKPISIMGASKKGALRDAWRESKQRTLKRLGLEEG